MYYYFTFQYLFKVINTLHSAIVCLLASSIRRQIVLWPFHTLVSSFVQNSKLVDCEVLASLNRRVVLIFVIKICYDSIESPT